jgi:hypothetical protein
MKAVSFLQLPRGDPAANRAIRNAGAFRGLRLRQPPHTQPPFTALCVKHSGHTADGGS